jgi:hypothetical protein
VLGREALSDPVLEPRGVPIGARMKAVAEQLHLGLAQVTAQDLQRLAGRRGDDLDDAPRSPPAGATVSSAEQTFRQQRTRWHR